MTQIHASRAKNTERVTVRTVFSFLNDDTQKNKVDENLSDTANMHSDLVLPYAIFDTSLQTAPAIFEPETTTSDDSEDDEPSYSVLTASKMGSVVPNTPFTSLQNSIIAQPDVVVPNFDPTELVLELFEMLANEGNVQMCVFLYLVLRNVMDLSCLPLELYTSAYIDLLHRFKLWPQATRIMHECNVQSIRAMNEVWRFN